jgi:hypothetical protein
VGSNGIAIRSAALVAAAVVLGLGPASCGEDDPPTTPRQAARAAIHDLQRDYRAGRLDEACSRMTVPARRQLADAVRDADGSCPRLLRELAALIDRVEAIRGRDRNSSAYRPSDEPPPVTSLALRGSRATATLSIRGSLLAVPLVERDGAWKLDAVNGGTTVKPALDGVAPVAVVSGRAVRVTWRRDGRAVACPPISGLGGPRPRGGCRAELAAKYVDSYFLTPFRELPFGNCDIAFGLRVAGNGRLAVDDLTIGGRGLCDSVTQCRQDGRAKPWRGRMAVEGTGPASDVDLRLGVCADSRLGRFAGPFHIRMRLDGSGWLGSAFNNPIGVSGWKLAGHWIMSRPGMRVEAARSPSRKAGSGQAAG